MIRLSSSLKAMAIFLFCSALLLFPGNGLGHGRDKKQDEKEVVYQKGNTNISIPDPVLINQEGKKVRFYNDLVKDRVVAINFIYTTCTTACPLLSATFSSLQELMGDRFNSDVYLISVSVDPVIDTPERLKAMAKKFDARPGWTFVTGEREEINKLLKALGAFTANKKDHTSLVLIGNESKGIWTRVSGLAQPVQMARIIDGMKDGVIE